MFKNTKQHNSVKLKVIEYVNDLAAKSKAFFPLNFNVNERKYINLYAIWIINKTTWISLKWFT